MPCEECCAWQKSILEMQGSSGKHVMPYNISALRRPFGSRVAETLLKRLEALLEDIAEEEAAQALQQVLFLLPHRL